MIRSLKVTNFAVVDEAAVEFGSGLTVLTGETGAGKSILVDALGLLVGGRAAAEVIRAGATEAVVEAMLEKTPTLAARLEELGLPDLGEEVVVRRVVGAGSKSRVHVNGSLTTVGLLGKLMRGVIDLAGQSIATAGEYSLSGGMRVLAAGQQARTFDVGGRFWLDVDEPEEADTAELLLREDVARQMRLASSSSTR
jgi:hypothetical protein